MMENGVNLDIFSPATWPVAPSARQPLRIVFVGRLAPVKGLPLLLNAMARVRSEFPVQLAVVGDGPMAEAWKSETAALGLTDCVTFYGARSAAEVAEQLRHAHVLCLPSVRESGGAVLLEAMACARPVIAVAFGGPAEIVDDGVGYAALPLTAEAVAEDIAYALRDIVQNPVAWRRRGEEGRRRAEQQYSWPMKIEQALVWYQKILQTREQDKC
jgi:glycosyltransferase involved in cell wall biosynthesis